jgi:hypothetical protein
MKRFRNLREDVEFAALPQELDPCGLGRERTEIVATPLHAWKRHANFTPKESPEISDILIGCTAIRNCRKSLKAKGGCHF